MVDKEKEKKKVLIFFLRLIFLVYLLGNEKKNKFILERKQNLHFLLFIWKKNFSCSFNRKKKKTNKRVSEQNGNFGFIFFFLVFQKEMFCLKKKGTKHLFTEKDDLPFEGNFFFMSLRNKFYG